MDADQLLDASRTATLAVANDGRVLAARGGFGGFLGIDLDGVVGTNVFDRLAPEDADELAVYFLENVGESAETIALPVPFRLRVIDDDGVEHFVDVIATGRQQSPDDWFWVVVLVPVGLTTSISRPLELEMAGAERHDVKRLLCEELASDNALFTSRTLLVELPGSSDDAAPPTIVVSRDGDRELADAVLSDLLDGWAPFTDVGEHLVVTVLPHDLPPRSREALGARGFRRVLITPVHVRNELRGALVLVSRVPDSYPLDVIKQNVARRLLSVGDATALLFERWDDQDRLVGEVTTDALTGLGNSRRLNAELGQAPETGTLLFIDVDHFKEVNDTYGHVIGDQVLVVVAERILRSCRDADVVTRLGGDEFVVVLVGAEGDAALEIGRRVLDAMSEPLGIDGGPGHVSVSIGTSPLRLGDPLDAADQAMLRAKRAGRGRLAVADNATND